jgi:hypothetical protein
MIKRIHVNQHNIRYNAKYPDTPKPVLTVKTYNENITGNEVVISGASVVRYSPNKPLSCGAKVWVETTSIVHVDGRTV